MKTVLLLCCLSLLSACALPAQGTYTMADTVLAKRYMEEAKGLMDSARYDAALEQLALAEEVWAGTVGREDTSYANVLHEKGRCFYFKRERDLGLKFYQKALEIRLEKLGDEHLTVAQSYNNIGNVYLLQGNPDSSNEYHKKSLKIRSKTLGPEHTNVADSYYNLGLGYSSKGDYNLSIECYLKALSIWIKTLGFEHSRVAAAYNNLGNAFRDVHDYSHAYEYHYKSLEIKLKILGPEHPDIALSYNNLGLVFDSKRDYSRAIEYFNKALNIRLKKLNPEHLHIADSYYNLGVTYGNKGDYDLEIEYYFKALDIRANNSKSANPDIAGVYNNIGTAYYHKGDFDRTLEYYQKALDIRLKKSGPEHPDIIGYYNNMGTVYQTMGNFNLAIEYYNKALEIWLKKYGSENFYVGNSYNNLGNAYSDRGDLDLAIQYHQKALDILIKILGPEHIEVTMAYSNLGSDYLDKSNYDRSAKYLQKALIIRQKILSPAHPDVVSSYRNLGILYNSIGNYSCSADYFNKALTSINAFRQSLDNPSSKSTLAKTSAGVCEGGIAVNYLLYQQTDSLHYLHEAFHYAEQSKALNLYEALKKAEALQIAGIPDSLLQREYDLRIDIAYHEKRRQDLYTQGKAETDTTALAVSGKIFDLRREYEALIGTFKVHYPDYYRAKYDLHVIDLPEIQALLQPDQALLEYFTGDSSVFIFLVKKDDYRVIEIKKDFPLEAWVNQLRHGIYSYFEHPERPDSLLTSTPGEYAGAAWRLYQKLLAPVDSLLPRRVTIIPDDVLGYVPFEALLKKKTVQPHQFHNHAYFGLDHILSYCYSATLWREMMQKKHKKRPQKMLLAMAPFEKKSYRQVEDLFGKVVANPDNDSTGLIAGGKRYELDSLPHSGEEVLTLARIWNDDYLLDRDATEVRFTDQAGDCRILHLATHGKADHRSGDYSFLAFAQIPDSVENEMLYVREIYNLSINADLVTLSACETAMGELQRGEGIISLARAFSYAGAKSIVTSLWPVSDASTKDLMIKFNRNLKKGLPKDEALAQAQRCYLKKHRGLGASPYFWAGFIAIGDMGTIDPGKP